MRSVGAADYAGAVGTGTEVPPRRSGPLPLPSGWRHAATAGHSRWLQEPGRAAATDCETGKGLPYFDWSV